MTFAGVLSFAVITHRCTQQLTHSLRHIVLTEWGLLFVSVSAREEISIISGEEGSCAVVLK